MCEVGADGCFHLLASKQSIQVDVSLYQGVVALHVGNAVAVSHSHRAAHAAEVVAAIGKLLYVNIGINARPGRIDVGAVALQFHLAAECAKVLLGQEVVQIEVVGDEVGIVGHRPCGVYVGSAGKRSLALCGTELCAVTVAVDAEVALDANAPRYVHAVHGALGQCSGQEVEVIGCGVGVEIGAQVIQVVKIFNGSAPVNVECGGQVGNKSGEFGMPHVARQYGVHLQRLCRPLGFHRRRHIHKLRKVLLAHITVGGEVHLSGHRLAEGVLVHHETCLQFRLRCLKVSIGKVNLLGVHREVGGEVAHVNAALLAERRLAYGNVYLWHAEVERVGFESHIAECQMAEIDST